MDQTPPPPLYCACSECAQRTTHHPETGVPTAGRWLPITEWNNHRQGPHRQGLGDVSMWNPDTLSAKTWTQFVEPSSLPRSTSPHTANPPPSDPPRNPSAKVGVDPIPGSTGAALAQSIDACLKRLKKLNESLLHASTSVRFSETPYFPHHYAPNAKTDSSLPQLKLSPNASSNSLFTAYERGLSDAEELVATHSKDEHTQSKVQLAVLSDTIGQYRIQYEKLLAEEWKRQVNIRFEAGYTDTERYFQNTLQLLPPNILALYLMVAALYLLSNVSQKDCAFMLAILKMTMENQAKTTTSIHAQTSAHTMLLGVDGIIQLLDIRPSPITYVCCKVCYCLYNVDPNRPSPNCPDRCTNQTEGGRCNALLHKTKNTPTGKKRVPVREFLYRDPADYISQMLARDDLAQWLFDNPTERPADPDNSWDIWDAPALRDFKFVDGKRFTSSTEESRLIFSLNFDGFNPGGNREAGKVVKVGAIYLVCLNLPPAIRYNIENMYLVGIVPGPEGPSTDEINHLLKPLIDDFLVLWRTGLYLSRTRRYPNGIRVRGTIVPLVCDLPAARQMAGSANYMHSNFCSVCKQTKSDINNLNCDSWEPRTWQEHKDQAERWRNAHTAKTRSKEVTAHGVRWSELLRLPYWDPTRFTLIDSMHAFYLRLFNHHIRKIWGMDINLEDGEGITRDRAAKAPDEASMQKAHQIFRHGTMYQLRALSRATLVELCRDTGTLPVRGKTAVILNRMSQYRISQGWFTKSGRRIPSEGEEGPIRSGEGEDGGD